ncbi:low molecular weight protein-tyrosine-phosphatase [Rhodoferax sp. PAMC 29310]|uniref:low molecular weight protein-tyrosine-phosphatase n=1 Tax=Rhodoferax sp. PAMC 29310 TaxID=2822760 RepID=UPI001F0A1BAC|nr:low molecular weight protein-tyrosine-phosphatase [Rhodoferax sp. PAMC 29310]
MALVVATKLSKEAGLSANFKFDSAGIHAEKGRKRSDTRVESVLLGHHYSIGKGRTRRIGLDDFEQFDLIIAMDRSNLAALHKICPEQHLSKLHLLLTFSPEVGQDEVPDPYFGNQEGFERVLTLCEAGVKGLLKAHRPQTL